MAVLIASPASVFGGTAAEPPLVVNLGPNGESALIPTEMVSLDLVGGEPLTVNLRSYPIPGASDPNNNLGDSIDGYGFVLSDIRITLSSQRDPGPGPDTLGYVQLIKTNPPAGPGPNSIVDGDEFLVDSFFDVFFDITITDVDPRPGRDYVGLPDGESITWPDVPTEDTVSSDTCTADISEPLLGCMTRNKLYVGGLSVIPLDTDVNGNFENDVVKLILQELTLGAGSQSILANGDIQVESGLLDSFFDVEGAVLDESADPPFEVQLIPESPNPPVIVVRPVPGALPELPGFPEEDDDDGDGLPNDDDPNPNDPCEPNPFGPACESQETVGGEFLSINTTSLLVAGVQTNLAWLLGVIVSGIGIVIVILKRK